MEAATWQERGEEGLQCRISGATDAATCQERGEYRRDGDQVGKIEIILSAVLGTAHNQSLRQSAACDDGHCDALVLGGDLATAEPSAVARRQARRVADLLGLRDSQREVTISVRALKRSGTCCCESAQAHRDGVLWRRPSRALMKKPYTASC